MQERMKARPPLYPGGNSATLLTVVASVFFALVSGCQKPVVVPPITPTPTGKQLTGKFVWMDLVTGDVKAARDFYGKLFGWQFEGEESKSTPFTLVKQGGTPIAGIVYYEKMDPAQQQARWLSYLSVPDVDRASDIVRQSGGEIFVEPRDLPQRGRIAVVLDPQKVPFGLLKATGGDPTEEKVTPFRWMWHELWTTDTTGAFLFYQKIFGYIKESMVLSVQRGTYTILKTGDTPQAGMAQIIQEGVKPIWLPYVNVEDPAAIAVRTLTLGGKVLIAPSDSIRNGTVAIVADPTGGIVAIQKWTPQDKLGK